MLDCAWWILAALMIGASFGVVVMALMFMARDPDPLIPMESLSPMDAPTV